MTAMNCAVTGVARGMLAAVLMLGSMTAGAYGQARPADIKRWQELQEVFFPGRQIEDGSGVVTLDAPKRAQDAALVPISVAVAPLPPEQAVRAVHLIIDNNPVPLAGVFRFAPGPATGPAAGSFSTRVRVNDYTLMHAVAETADGRLLVAERFVKASGGCSAPALKDPEQALARLGKMQLKLAEPVQADLPVTAQILVSHPNNSGLQFDQITRNYIPPHFVRTIKIDLDGRELLSAETDISLSEDPSLHFSFVPHQAGQLNVEVTDTKEGVYRASWPISPQSAALQ
jgi:sulfur-oxidizing protein SoxY